MGGHHADHRIVKVDIVRQGVGIQRDPVFAILSGIRQDGIPAPVGAYPGLVFHFHAAGAGAFTSTTVSFNGWLRVMPLACASTPPLTP